MRIKRLSTTMADEIAAGEVIERPASVVKELVENSIDARSSSIEIHVCFKKRYSIMVHDDGQGIFKEDLPLAFSRHATSKIEEMEDFYSLKTLGFRGEALASIASIAKVLLKTRRREEAHGSLLEIHRGKIIEERGIPKNPGTQIQVDDLFYNTPARLKHLRQTSTEFGHCSSIASQLALAFPTIGFLLKHNKKKVFQTPGNGDLYNTIFSLFGDRVTSSLLPIELSKEYVAIEGYLSSPSYTRKSSNQIFFYVNNRFIKNSLLKKVALEALRGYLPKGEYPFLLLKIDMNPVHIDANVHPQKLTIRFSRFEAVAKILREALAKTIDKEQRIPTLPLQQRETEQVRERPLNLSLGFYKREEREEKKEREERIHSRTERERVVSISSTREGIPSNLVFLGQLYQTYLLLQGEEAFYLMDQHAAHERILYQRLLTAEEEEDPKSQLLLTPLTLQISPKERALLENEMERLKEIGFQIEPFGEDSFLLRAVPLYLDSLSQEALQDLFQDLLERDGREKDHDLLSIMACHGAIRAGEHLTYEEIRALIEDLKKTNNPFQCPHGRPTILSMTRKELDEYFMRR